MKYVVFVAAVSALALLAVGTNPSLAGDNTCQQPTQCVITVASADAVKSLLVKVRRPGAPRGGVEVAFCGQCTRNSDCGVGFKCAGKPTCMECVRSP